MRTQLVKLALITALLIAAAGFFPVAALSSTPKEKPAYIEFIRQTYADRLKKRAALLQNPAWQDFKAIWQQLDNYSLSSAGNDPNTSQFLISFSGTISLAEADELRKKLKGATTTLQLLTPATLSSFEATFLSALCSDRISLLSMGPPSLYCRMIVTGLTNMEEIAAGRLACKLEQLQKLKSQNHISPHEYEEALENIFSEVKLLALTQTLQANYNLPYERRQSTGWNTQADLDYLLQKIESQPPTNPKLQARYQAARLAIQKLKTEWPNLETLIISLEN